MLHHFVGGWKNLEKKTKLVNPILSQPQLPEAASETSPSLLGYPVTVRLPRSALLSATQSVLVFVEPMRHSFGFNGAEEGATITAWGSWQGSMSPGDHDGIVEVRCRVTTSLVKGARQDIFFVEFGSSTGINALVMAKQGIRSLSFPKSQTDALRIAVSAEVSGCTDYLFIEALEHSVTSNLAKMRRFLGAAVAESILDHKLVVHVESYEGLSLLSFLFQMSGSSLAYNVSWHLSFATLAVADSRSEEMENLFNSALDSEGQFIIAHAGSVCRETYTRTQNKGNIAWLLRTTLKLFIRAKYTGPSVSVRKHSFFKEQWCQITRAMIPVRSEAISKQKPADREVILFIRSENIHLLST